MDACRLAEHDSASAGSNTATQADFATQQLIDLEKRGTACGTFC